MIRPARIALLALGLAACAGRPPAPPAAPPIGAPSGLVAWIEVDPAALEERLSAFDARVGDQTALGPVGVALRRVRALVEDRLTDLAPAGDRVADGWSAWGLARGAPIRIGLAAPDGAALGRALVEALGGGRATLDGLAVWRLRIVAGVDDTGRVRDGLERLAARAGWTVEPRGADGRWRAREPGGPSLSLTIRETTDGRQAALDVALPASPTARVDPAPSGETPWPPALSGPVSGGLLPSGLAVLESSVQAASALARAEGAGAAGRDVLSASAELLTACVDRWQQAAGLSSAIVAALDAPDGRPRFEARVGLTERGAAAWRAARTPQPLATLDGLPAAIQVAAAAERFPGVDPDWPTAAACAAGHPLALGLVGLAVAPTLARPALLPVPGPVGGWPAAGLGIAAAVTGAVRVEEQAVPALAGLVRVGPDHPVDRSPLGADALRPTAEVHARPGPMPVTFGDHRSGDGRVLIFGLGPGAHGAFIDRLDVAPTVGPVVAGHVDPAALADALAAAGETGAGVAALRALGQRFGRFEVRAVLDDRMVRWRLLSRAADGGRELDRAPPPK